MTYSMPINALFRLPFKCYSRCTFPAHADGPTETNTPRSVPRLTDESNNSLRKFWRSSVGFWFRSGDRRWPSFAFAPAHCAPTPPDLAQPRPLAMAHHGAPPHCLRAVSFVHNIHSASPASEDVDDASPFTIISTITKQQRRQQQRDVIRARRMSSQS